MDKVTIYTDGACSYNPGPGGWGAILMYGENKKEISGGKKETTNNEMELTAAYEALKMLKHPCEVELYSDSSYLINGFIKKWIDNWQKNNWRTANKRPVKNKELWVEIYKLTQVHKVKFIKVKGHSDNIYNNRCDEMARNETSKFLNN